MWDHERFEELRKSLKTPSPFAKGLPEIVDFLLMPAYKRSLKYREFGDDFYTSIILGGLPPRHSIFCNEFHSKLMELTPRDFEMVVGNLLKNLGGNVGISGKGADGGIDLTWNTPDDYLIQCKRTKNKVEVGVVREIHGVLSAPSCKAKGAFIVTADEFTNGATLFVSGLSSRIGLINGWELFNLMTIRVPSLVEDIAEGRWKSNG